MPDEAQFLDYVFSMNFRELFVSLVIIAVCGLGIYAIIHKIQDIIGIETKTMRNHRLINETIQSLKEKLDSLKEAHESDWNQVRQFNEKLMKSHEELMDTIDVLQKTIEKNEIEDLRWTILNFGNAISNDRRYDAEAYTHIIEIFDDYEKMLVKNGMENGRVTVAMKLIKEKYERGLREGFPV